MAAVFKLVWNGGASPLTLADSSAGDVLFNRRLNGQLVAQLAPALRAAAQTSLNRGNAQHVFTFTNRRPSQPSPVKAAQFIFDHAIALKGFLGANGQSDGALTLDDKTYTLKSMVVRSANAAQEGTTTVHEYEIAFGDLTQP